MGGRTERKKETASARPRNIVRTVGPATSELRPIGFRLYAKKFLAAAKRERSQMGPTFSPVPYYLYCRSVELGLKAFLLTAGVSAAQLKKPSLGHNLVNLWKTAQQKGLASLLTAKADWPAELHKANDYYNVPIKGFEYFKTVKAVTTYPNLPKLDALDELASALVAKLKTVM